MDVEERSVKASPLKLPLPKSEPLALPIPLQQEEEKYSKRFSELCLVGCQMQKLLKSCSHWTEATIDAPKKPTALVIKCISCLPITFLLCLGLHGK